MTLSNIALPKLPGVKDLVPYLVVALVTFGGSMWARLGDRDKSCDERVQLVEKQCHEKELYYQAKLDRQEARIDSATAKVDRLAREQLENFKMLEKLKKR